MKTSAVIVAEQKKVPNLVMDEEPSFVKKVDMNHQPFASTGDDRQFSPMTTTHKSAQKLFDQVRIIYGSSPVEL